MPRIGLQRRLALLIPLSLCAAPALALQPFEEFLAGARRRNPDELEARANLAERQGAATSALGPGLPGGGGRGAYTRNPHSAGGDLAPPGHPPKPVPVGPSNQ